MAPRAGAGRGESAAIALRALLSSTQWSALDSAGAVLLPGALPAALVAPVAAQIAHSAIETHGLRTKYLTRSSSNGEGGYYTVLSRSLVPPAVNQLCDEVGAVLRERYGGGTSEVLARPSTGEGECLVMHYARGGINYAHRDQPRGSAYLFQLLVCLSSPGEDFAGGKQ